MAYRPTEKTEARKRAQHHKLLNAAMTVVANGGFSELTIAAVAETANVATGTVYKYFDNKAHLCAEVFKAGSGKEVAQVRDAAFPEQSGHSCQQRLLDAIRRFSERAIAGHKLAYSLIAEPVDPMVEAERLIYRRAYAEVFSALIEEGITSGEFVPQNVEISAAAIVGALAETLVGPLGLGEPESDNFDPQHLISQIQRFCLNAVLSENPGQRKTG